jgi:hypothetical protein
MKATSLSQGHNVTFDSSHRKTPLLLNIVLNLATETWEGEREYLLAYDMMLNL